MVMGVANFIHNIFANCKVANIYAIQIGLPISRLSYDYIPNM